MAKSLFNPDKSFLALLVFRWLDFRNRFSLVYGVGVLPHTVRYPVDACGSAKLGATGISLSLSSRVESQRLDSTEAQEKRD